MIDIDRFQFSIRAHTVRERVPAIEARLRDVAQGPLLRALRSLDERALGADDGTLVFIDRLALGLAVNTAWADDTLAMHLARGMAGSVAASLAATGAHPAPGVRRFADRAAWLAQYLVDRVDGGAARHWWFDELDGLAMLPVPTALRTVLTTQGEDAFAAIAQLSEPLLARVLTSLGELEQARVLKAWRERPGGNAVPVARLLAAATQTRQASNAETLRAAVALERKMPGAIHARSIDMLGGLSALVHALAAEPALAAGLRADALAQTCQRVGMDTAWLTGLNLEERNTLRQGLLALVPDEADTPPRSAGAAGVSAQGAPPRTAAFSARSPHGGVFVLATVMHWRRWLELAAQVLQAWPEAAGVAPQLGRALLLAAAARALQAAPVDGEGDDIDGGKAPRATRQPPVVHDSALARAFDVPAAPDALALPRQHTLAASAVLRAWIRDAAASSGAGADARGADGPDTRAPEHEAAGLDALLHHAGSALLTVLAARVPGCEAASPAWLRANLLSGSAQLDLSPERGALDVRLTRAPLHVLLLVAGLTSGRWRLPGPAGVAGWQVNVTTEDAA